MRDLPTWTQTANVTFEEHKTTCMQDAYVFHTLSYAVMTRIFESFTRDISVRYVVARIQHIICSILNKWNATCSKKHPCYRPVSTPNQSLSLTVSPPTTVAHPSMLMTKPMPADHSKLGEIGRVTVPMKGETRSVTIPSQVSTKKNASLGGGIQGNT